MDDERVRGSVIDAVDVELVLRVRKGPCVPVELDDDERESREEPVVVRVAVTERLEDDVEDRVCVWIAEAEDVDERVLLVVPRSVRVPHGVLEDEWVPRMEIDVVEVELVLRVPCVVRDAVEDDDELLEEPRVRDAVDDDVGDRDRMELPVVVSVVQGVDVVRADAVAVRVGTVVHVGTAVPVDVQVPTDVCV